MARYPYRILKNAFDRVFRNDLNKNFEDIEADIKSQKNRVDNLINEVEQPSEVVDARVDADGHVYNVLKERLDTEQHNTEVELLDHDDRIQQNSDDIAVNNQSIHTTNQNLDALTSEVVDARVDADGKNYSTLKERLDTEHSEFTSQLADVVDRSMVVSSVKKSSTIIPKGDSLDWDENIREIGNYITDENQFIVVYSGYQGAYNGDNVYVGYAYSEDGEMWYKGGKLIERASEDPYLVKHDGVYHLYVEDKEVVPFRNIRLFTSEDFEKWEDKGVVLDTDMGWESQDVSSPVVWVENNNWYMLYEGRNGEDNSGSVGLATSFDGVSWKKSNKNPVMTGDSVKWAGSVVPDDIKKIKGKYYLLFHGTMKNSVSEIKNVPGLSYSYDFFDWFDLNDFPISMPSATGTLMFFENQYIYNDQQTGISTGISSKNKSFISLSKQSSDVDATSGSWQPIDFMTDIVIDTKNEFNGSNKIVIKQSGLYNIRLRLNANYLSEGARFGARLKINGSEGDVLFNPTNFSNTPVIHSGNTQVYLHSGDELEFDYYTNSTEGATITGGRINVNSIY